VPAHWFWGNVPSVFVASLIEVANGTFVANLLAVAVALFSLQVYETGDPAPVRRRRYGWLAAGAGLALLMEASSTMARARLMDGQGRQIRTIGARRLDAPVCWAICGRTRAAKRPTQLVSAMP